MDRGACSKVDKDAKVDKDSDLCVICLNTFNNKSKVLPCMHHFCYLCIKKWYNINKCCPLCKTKIKEIKNLQIESFQMRYPENLEAGSDEDIDVGGPEDLQVPQFLREGVWSIIYFPERIHSDMDSDTSSESSVDYDYIATSETFNSISEPTPSTSNRVRSGRVAATESSPSPDSSSELARLSHNANNELPISLVSDDESDSDQPVAVERRKRKRTTAQRGMNEYAKIKKASAVIDLTESDN